MSTLSNECLAMDETITHSDLAVSVLSVLRQTKQGNTFVLPQDSDLSTHFHMITSPILGATTETSAARLRPILSNLLMSHNKLCSQKNRQTVSHKIFWYQEKHYNQ